MSIQYKMDQPIIEVKGISKKYRLGTIGARSLREEAELFWEKIRRRRSDQPRERAGDFWALRDISFQVQKGDVVGIIGRNGAGKSTLLKILSRITEPTSGEAVLRGRVASLLEVGTGFHPELSGRENVYLNGAILGMTRRQIAARFDEIVAFAEVEQFVDTPVKRYSSGMQVRLAFAVAAHLDAEILIVDEVLAVGDAAFQRKCAGKMQETAGSEGRTVLFVSHNIVAVEKLCNRGVVLDQGQLILDSTASAAAAAYVRQNAASASGEFDPNHVKGDGRARLLNYAVTNADPENRDILVTGAVLDVRLEVEILEDIAYPACAFTVWNEQGTRMTAVSTPELGVTLPAMKRGRGEVHIRYGPVPMLPGRFKASFYLSNSESHVYASVEEQIIFEIIQTPLYGSRELDFRWGCVYVPTVYEWNQK